MNNTYTGNPEVDFADNPYILNLFNFFKSSIVYFIYLERYKMTIPELSSLSPGSSIANYVFENPYTFQTIVSNSKVYANEIFHKINEEEFNGENVLFDNMDKFKQSPFFNDFCFLVDYIEHMPNFEQLVNELNEESKRNYNSSIHQIDIKNNTN